MINKFQKKLSKVPDWFLLERYKDASEFSLNDWLKAFEFRAYMALLLDILKDESAARQNRNAEKTKLELARRLMVVQEKGASAHKAYRFRNDDEDFESAVSSIEVMEVYEIADAIKGNPPSQYQEAYEKFSADLEELGEAYPSDLLMENAHDALDPDCFPIHQVAFAKVNLRAPDSTIIENFSAWLKQIRKQHKHVKGGRERRYSQKDTDKWFHASILPYLDICLWAECQGVDIPDWVIGEAIFPIDRQINTSEAVRKTTDPLAQKIWSRELTDSLRADLSGRARRSVNN